jgi:uncharacterized membrane protein
LTDNRWVVRGFLYVHATAVLGILLLLIVVGHAVLGLLRNLRKYRDGR